MTLCGASRRRWRLGLVATVATTTVAFGTPVSAAPAEGTVLHTGGATAVADSYLVVLRDSAVTRARVAERAGVLAARHGGAVERTYQHAVRGFAVRLSAARARRLAADPTVKYVEQNHTVSIAGTQSPTPSWGLDRIDQRTLPLDNSYTHPNGGAGVRAYIVDTGINVAHDDFGGRAVSGFDAVDGGSADDGNGHGTHVAGTVGGTAHGVAKDVTLVGVRVLNNAGNGTLAQVISGLDWVTADHDPGEPAVANLSLGSRSSQAVNDAVAASIADGVTVAAAAGNETTDACTRSPASTPAAITVGATTSTDVRASYSNYGACLDIFAPGSSITSAWIGGVAATNTISGTSMAAPHVAGAAALVLAANPTYTPQQVRDKLGNDASDGVLTSPGTGSPNLLLNLGDATPPSQDFGVSVAPAAGAVDLGASVTATVSTGTTVGDPQPVTFSATGLPAGVTATFGPSSVTSGEPATLTFSADGTATPGRYAVSIVAAGPVTTQRTSYTLTVNGPPGCSQTNGTDTPIPDNTTVESSITISGCADAASATSTVAVNIVHTFIGDLRVTLFAPDGTPYLLHNRLGSETDNLNQAFQVDLSSESSNGTWRLWVGDWASSDSGYLDTWTLALDAVPPPGCTGTNDTDVAIPEFTIVESAIEIADCPGNGNAMSTVAVRIAHTFIGDLLVSLVAPDGTAYLLHNRSGSGLNEINRTYSVNLSGGPREGTWRLRVQDVSSPDTGHIDTWTLRL